MGAVSSVALLDLLDAPKTTGSARRLAQNMRALGFIPLKSRRLAPGGFRDTTIRGWMQSFRKHQCLSPQMNLTAGSAPASSMEGEHECSEHL